MERLIIYGYPVARVYGYLQFVLRNPENGGKAVGRLGRKRLLPDFLSSDGADYRQIKSINGNYQEREARIRMYQ